MNKLLERMPALQQALDQFQSLSARDQLAVKALATFAALFGLYAGAINPIVKANAEADQLLTDRQELFDWLNQVGPQAKANAPTTNSGPKGPGAQISSTVNRIFSTNQVKLQKFENDPKGGLRIWVDDVPFDNLAKALATLEASHGITVAQMTLDADKKPGVVSGRGVLQK